MSRVNGNSIHPARSLRSKLLGVFIMYGLVLLAGLWALQIGLMEVFYQTSMQRKCRNSLNELSSLYSSSEVLYYDDFYESLNDLAIKNDIFFYVEATDRSFSMSSAGETSGSIFLGGVRIISDARTMLESSAHSEISYKQKNENGAEVIVLAKNVESKNRGPIYIYAVAPLTPLGPAVGILRSQLLLISLGVLALGAVIAFITSRRLAKPIAELNESAKNLGKGRFDVEFKGADYEEINELAATLNSAEHELKKSDDLRKDLLANVSHDLRTPLTMIKSYAEMIRDISGDNKEKREEHIGVIIEESDRLSELVGGILELSRVQSGTEKFDMKPFDLCKAAEEVFQTYKIMESEGFTMRFEPWYGNCTVIGDEARIKQVISNLLSNAIKYSEERKEVSLYFAQAGSSLRLCVEDKGIGIPKEDCERIWSRYQRASKKSARAKDGSGLGLSICSEILKRHSADFGVLSTIGEGSTFWFEMKNSAL